MRKIKPLIFPGTVLAASVYWISFLFAVGIIIGYIITTLFHKKLIQKGRIKEQINIPFWRWKLHLHHWLMGTCAIFLIWLIGLYYIFPTITFGMIGGMIFHDLHVDQDWYKIISKKS